MLAVLPSLCLVVGLDLRLGAGLGLSVGTGLNRCLDVGLYLVWYEVWDAGVVVVLSLDLRRACGGWRALILSVDIDWSRCLILGLDVGLDLGFGGLGRVGVLGLGLGEVMVLDGSWGVDGMALDSGLDVGLGGMLVFGVDLCLDWGGVLDLYLAWGVVWDAGVVVVLSLDLW